MKKFLPGSRLRGLFRASGSFYFALPSPKRRTVLALSAIATAAALAMGGLPGVVGEANAATGPQTVVSLTFDDSNANQLAAAATMNSLNLDGTFYTNSGFIGAQNYLSRANLNTLKANGHEIAGHTVNHPDLATIPAAEATRQICNDRNTLLSWGFAVRSFAYPFASSTPEVETLVKNCGYNSARMLGDIRSRFGCADCGFAAATPPANPYYTQALDQVDSTWTLADMKSTVTNAEAAGGWVQLTFHNICSTTSGCAAPSTTSSIFRQFVQWLAPRSTTKNTVVRTVGAVIGGAVKPAVAAASTPPAGPGVNAIVNPSLETLGSDGLPSCFMRGGYGVNTAAFTMVTPGRTGTRAAKVTVTGYSDGDAKLLPTFDGGACSPTVTPGNTYSLRAWYKSTTPTQFAVYLRNPIGVWQYWTSSPWYAVSAATFTQAIWTSPAIPAGMTGISFGLNVFANGEITTDDYALYDSIGAPVVQAPATALVAPLQPPPVTGPVEVQAGTPMLVG